LRIDIINLEKGKKICYTENEYEDYLASWCKILTEIRENKLNAFYKVRYIGKEESLLDKVTISNYYLCFGIKDDKLLLINDDGSIFPCDILQKGKVAFEVLEDDDECSLSKQINELKEK